MSIGELWDYEAKAVYYFIGISGKPCRFTTEEEIKVGDLLTFKYIPLGTTLVKVTDISVGKTKTFVQFELVKTIRAVEVRDGGTLAQYDLKDDQKS
ncbi:MAG TPA: hypothetical protein VK190_03780 [Pseudoneobacillus sp.]|nr:hypothetical protein [Pseudoneobacillus sp.]